MASPMQTVKDWWNKDKKPVQPTTPAPVSTPLPPSPADPKVQAANPFNAEVLQDKLKKRKDGLKQVMDATN